MKFSRAPYREISNELVSVCGIWQWRRHSCLLSQRAFLVFAVCPSLQQDGYRLMAPAERIRPQAPTRIASNRGQDLGAAFAALRSEPWRPTEGNLARTCDIR